VLGSSADAKQKQPQMKADARGLLEVWRQLVEPGSQSLREAAAVTDASDVAAIARLRQRWPVELVQAALNLATARAKARMKFPERAASLVADAEGVEQASSISVARHKANRFSEGVGDEPGAIVDLACGIGGDALSLGEAGNKPVAIDREPLRAWMARQNVGCPAAAADVSDVDVTGRLCHLDPGRRQGGKRSRSIHLSEPGPAAIDTVNKQSAGLALKLSPAVDPAELPRPGELEFISDAGRLVQSVLWTGTLAGDTARRATRLEHGQAHSLCGEVGSAQTGGSGTGAAPPLGERQRYLFTVDPAMERAGLLGKLCEQLDLDMPHPQLGLLTADDAAERARQSVWLTGFELLAHMPWRLKRVQQWLAAHDGGLIEVKTRGQAVDPNRVQKQLRGQGSTSYTVFILRWDTKRVALITRRI